MKKISIVILVVFFSLLFGIGAVAQENSEEYESQQIESTGVYDIAKDLDETTKKIISELGIDEINADSLFNISFSSFFTSIKDIFFSSLSTVLKTFLVVCGTIFIAALSSTFSDVFTKEKSSGIFNICACLLVMGAVIVPMSKCISSVGSAIKTGSVLMLSLIPVLCILMAAGGKALSAVGFNGMSTALAEVISTLCAQVFMPFSNILLGVGMMAGINENLPVDKLISGVRKYLSVILGIIASLYFSVLGVKSTIGTASDTVGLKATKLIVGNFVPVIGSAISDSVSTISSYVGLTKSVVGAFGIVAIISIFMPALIQAILWLVCFEVSSFLASIFSLSAIEKLLKNIASAVSVLVIMLLFVELMFVINFGMIMALRGAG